LATPDNLRSLPPARQVGGLPLMQALAARRSQRAFSSEPLPDQLLADLLWAWFDRNALSQAMGLTEDEQVLFAQTVGYAERGTLPQQATGAVV
jgi:hypothetical protein